MTALENYRIAGLTRIVADRNYVTGSGHTSTLAGCSTAECNPTASTTRNRFSSTDGYSYDENGSITQDAKGQRFGYDAESHQTSFFASTNSGSTPDTTYYYDGNGKRVKKVSSSETTVFVYDAGGQLIAEYSSVSATTPQVSYVTQDHLGSTRVVTNENGAVTNRKDYMAFGEVATSSQRVGGSGGNGYDNPTTRHDYTGYQKDEESGLEFAQARYFSSQHGRFTSVDPLPSSATIKDPQSFNRYTYALNSPYKFTDPLGLRPHPMEPDVNVKQEAWRWSVFWGEVYGVEGRYNKDGSVISGTTNGHDAEPQKRVYGKVTQFDRQTDILTRAHCAGYTRETCTPVPGSEEKIVVSDEVNAIVVASDEDTGEKAKEDPRTGLFAGDERGHLIAKALGGAGNESNLFSQNPTFNKGEFIKWENRIRAVLTENPTWAAQINIKLNYPLPMRHPWIQGIYSIESYYIGRALGINYMRATTVSYSVTFRDPLGNVTQRMSSFFSNP